MISKIKIHRGFKAAVNYNLSKIENGKGQILDSNISIKDKEIIIKQFELMASKRPQLSRNCFHVSLAGSPEEKISDQTFVNIGNEYLEKMGFNNSQYIIIKHTDTDHPHIHIIANRVTFDGEVVTESHNRYHTQIALREIEEKNNLQKVENSFSESRNKKERNVTKGEIALFERTGQYSSLIKLESILKNEISHSNSLDQFIQNLNNYKVGIYFNIKDENVLGLSYNYEGLAVKGRNMGEQFKWENIKKHFNHEQIKPTQTILRSNERERARANQNGRPKRVSSETLKSFGFNKESVGNKRERTNRNQEKHSGNGKDLKTTEGRANKHKTQPTNSFKGNNSENEQFERRTGRIQNQSGSNQNQQPENANNNFSDIINDIAYHLSQVENSRGNYYWKEENSKKKKKKDKGRSM